MREKGKAVKAEVLSQKTKQINKQKTSMLEDG